MTETQTDALPPQVKATLQAQLRDIHLPAPASWWPPAPGWWLLLGIGLCAAVLAWRALVPRWQMRQYRRYLRQELAQLRQRHKKTGPSINTVNACAILLKRICLKHLPREQVSALTGTTWVTFLNTQTPATPFSGQSASLLATERFQSNAPNGPAIDTLLDETQRWIERFLKGVR